MASYRRLTASSDRTPNGGRTMHWGPLPDLMKRLAAALPHAHGRVAAAARPYGGPWGAISREAWQGAMALEHPWFLARWFRGTRGEHPTEELTRDLARSHEWLERKNQQYLRPRLGPEVEVVPSRLTSVSDIALAWAVQLYEAVEGSRSPYLVPPAGTPRTGDLLALHRMIEGIVCSRAGPFHPRDEESPRRLGGLRDPHFLQAYPALVASTQHRDQRLAAIVAAYLPHSPLTLLVYPDLFGIVPTAGSCSALWNGPKNTTEPDTWRESRAIAAWISQLARTLVAAILSPTPSWEAWLAAEDHHRRCRAIPTPGLFGTLLGQSYRLSQKILRAGSRAAALQSTCRWERLHRLGVLAGILRGPEGDVGSRAVHYRTLDMLIRHVVVSEHAGIYADWRTARSGPLEVDAARVLFAADGAAIRRFVEWLMGQPPDEFAWSNLNTPAWQDAFRFLLDPPRITAVMAETPGLAASVLSVAKALGVSDPTVQQLFFHFERTELQLPIPQNFATVSPSPSAVLTEWYVHLANRLVAIPVPSAATEITTE
jgi:hypothetical protein